MKIKVGVSMGLSGCKIEDVIEVEDNATAEEVEEAAREWTFNHIEWWYE